MRPCIFWFEYIFLFSYFSTSPLLSIHFLSSTFVSLEYLMIWLSGLYFFHWNIVKNFVENVCVWVSVWISFWAQPKVIANYLYIEFLCENMHFNVLMHNKGATSTAIWGGGKIGSSHLLPAFANQLMDEFIIVFLRNDSIFNLVSGFRAVCSRVDKVFCKNCRNYNCRCVFVQLIYVYLINLSNRL